MGSMNAGGPPNPGGYPPQQEAAGGLQQNLAATLCYVLGIVTGIVFLVLEPYNKDKLIRFHAFQSIFLGVAVFVLAIVLTIVSTVLSFIPFLGIVAGLIGLLLSLVLWLGFLGVWLFVMYKTYNNQRVVLPIIGPLAEKQA